MTAPVFDQDAFRGRDDDVAVNSSTFNGGGGLNGNWSQNVDTTFRVRFVVQETNGKSVNNKILQLRYQKNGAGGYQPITAASTNVKLVNDSQSIADHATTSQVIGSGTYVTGDSQGWDDGQTDDYTGNIDFAGNDEAEVEFCIQLVAADVANNDTFELRVYESSGTALNNYTNTPTVTAVESGGSLIQFSAVIGGVTSTTDTASLAIQRQLAAVSAGATSTPDTVSLAIQRRLAATTALQTTTSAPVLGFGLDYFRDDFDDNSLDSALWEEGTPLLLTADPSVSVSEANQRIEITPITSSGAHYNGIKSLESFDFTDGEFQVEVVQAAQQTANNTILFIGFDNQNGMKIETDGTTLYFTIRIADTPSSTNVTYNATNHRWWRIRHVSSDDTLRWDTSSDGIFWTQQWSAARSTLDITALKVHLYAGTWSSIGSPDVTIFDNAHSTDSYSANVQKTRIPSKNDWLGSSAPSVAISAGSDGQWDFVLWGAATPSCMVRLGATYYLYYIGAKNGVGPDDRALGVASGTDGINFTKYGSNPIITYTTGGSAEEGVGGACAIVVNGTIHLYYGAIVDVGGGDVDLHIRYRKSTDGVTFTDDSLIYSSTGDEYNPCGVIYDGTTWTLYIRGPMIGGRGPIKTLEGTSPTVLGTLTSIDNSHDWGNGADPDYIDTATYVQHLLNRESGEDQIFVYAVDETAPQTLGNPIFTYTIGEFTDFPAMCTYRDNVAGKWFMYQLSSNDVIVRPILDLGFFNPVVTIDGQTSTSDTASLGVQRQLSATIAGQTSTNDSAVLDVATGGLVQLSAVIGGVTATPDTVSLAIQRQLAAVIAWVGTTNDAASLAVQRQLVAAVGWATTTPDVASLVIQRQLAAVLAGQTITPDTASLVTQRQLAAAIAMQTSTNDSAVLLVSGLIQLAAIITGQTATPDAASLAIQRQLAAAIAALASTPDTASLVVQRQLAAAIAMQISTPDSASLVIQRQLAAAIAALTSTPDTASLVVQRQLASIVAWQTSTNDSAVLSISGQIQLAAVIGWQGATPDTASLAVQRQLAAALTWQASTNDSASIAVLRQLAAVVEWQTTTPDSVTMLLQRALTAVIAGQTSSNDTAVLSLQKALAAAIGLQTITNDSAVLLVSGLAQLAATIAGQTVTPDTASLSIQRQLAALLAGQTVTPDAASLVVQHQLAAVLAGQTDTNDAATLSLQKALAAAIAMQTSAPDTVSLVVQRQLAALSAWQTATPDDATMITAAIVGLISVAIQAKRAGAAFTGSRSEAEASGRRSEVFFLED